MLVIKTIHNSSVQGRNKPRKKQRGAMAQNTGGNQFENVGAPLSESAWNWECWGRNEIILVHLHQKHADKQLQNKKFVLQNIKKRLILI